MLWSCSLLSPEPPSCLSAGKGPHSGHHLCLCCLRWDAPAVWGDGADRCWSWDSWGREREAPCLEGQGGLTTGAAGLAGDGCHRPTSGRPILQSLCWLIWVTFWPIKAADSAILVCCGLSWYYITKKSHVTAPSFTEVFGVTDLRAITTVPSLMLSLGVYSTKMLHKIFQDFLNVGLTCVLGISFF